MSRGFTFVTIHPDFISAYGKFGVMRAAQAKDLARIDVVNLRDHAIDKHGTVDDVPYGGGDGMVMRPEPLAAAVQAIRASTPSVQVILTSPAGKLWRQQDACEFAAKEQSLVFICGRFAGVDQRFIDGYVDQEYSLGDFVLSGGELAALAMADSILRFVPGVLGHAESAAQDSFAPGFQGGLEHPLYTRPQSFDGQPVPDVLTSGDHQAIAKWRVDQAALRTKERRPDLLPDPLKPQ